MSTNIVRNTTLSETEREWAILNDRDVNRRFRIPVVCGGTDSYSHLINKPLIKKISGVQFGLAIVICGIQIVTIGWVFGNFYNDVAGDRGLGFLVFLTTALAAGQTRWCVRAPGYRGLHLAFALHIVNTTVAFYMIWIQFNENIRRLRDGLGEALFGDSPKAANNVSVPLLTICLILNSIMATAGIAQLVLSFVITMMTGRAICCRQSKTHGKYLEMEVVNGESGFKLLVLRREGGLDENERNNGNINNVNVENGSMMSFTSEDDRPVAP